MVGPAAATLTTTPHYYYCRLRARPCARHVHGAFRDARDQQKGWGGVVKTTFRDTTKGRKRGGRCDTTVNFTQGQGQGRLIEKVRVAGKVPQEQWIGGHFSPECATRCQIQHLEATNGEERGSGEHAGRKEKQEAQAAIEEIIGTKTTGAIPRQLTGGRCPFSPFAGHADADTAAGAHRVSLHDQSIGADACTTQQANPISSRQSPEASTCKHREHF